MKLSLCIPTFNEEKNIHYPLDSAYDLADEVILIDAGSTDKTVEIAKSYGEKIKVFIVDNPKNFLINKQRAIEKSTGEWILQLDADEALSEELKKEILNIFEIQKGARTFEVEEERSDGKTSEVNENMIIGYNIPRKNWFLTRFLMKGGVYPDYVLRLYKRECAHFNLEHLHENVVLDCCHSGDSASRRMSPESLSNNTGSETSEVNDRQIGYLKNPILHYADPDFSRYLTRWNRYTSFDAEKLAKEKKNLGFWDFINYFVIKPKVWFFMTYFRHKGFMDGFPGFIFSLFSAIRFWTIFIKAWNINKTEKV